MELNSTLTECGGVIEEQNIILLEHQKKIQVQAENVENLHQQLTENLVLKDALMDQIAAIDKGLNLAREELGKKELQMHDAANTISLLTSESVGKDVTIDEYLLEIFKFNKICERKDHEFAELSQKFEQLSYHFVDSQETIKQFKTLLDEREMKMSMRDAEFEQ